MAHWKAAPRKHEDGSLESSTEEARELLDQQLLQNPHFEGAISAQASAFINASGDTKSSLIATLQEQTKWLDFPTVRHMLMQTTRPLSEAKTRDDIVLSFVVPVLSLREELQPLLRAFTNFTTYTFEAVKHKKGQCLCIIDEVQAQGYNQTLEVALPVARSYGQSIVAIAQDIEGMKAAYPKTYRSFEGNADAVLFMASNHPDNLKHISDVLGKRSWVKRNPRTGQEAQRWTASVMSAEQVKRFLSPHHGNLIAVLAGGRALKLKITNYFHELPVTRYQADPDHKEPLRKRIPRFLLNFPKSRPRRPDTGGEANARHANSAAPYSIQQRNHTGEP
ncbi:type IV secretory system conjugative DNA transfer family protein [Alteromonas sp. a30]|uniref:type IV secretory system conjugative DNA transfer family protein n=1 Tax=Alteromonas sp. a30 TaxID=2730917 RepID=UPI00228073D1|nr:type IV secretory system conjugative DNA transfer family protein [Alteromonas sp. a30]MCY7297385.1 type IV secretory system conjugative DNA transfer family protein [Alteromonas sp. a30]